MSRWTAWAALAAALALGASALPRAIRAQDSDPPAVAAGDPPPPPPAVAPATSAPRLPSGPALRPGDTVEIAVLDQDTLGQTATVQPDGTLPVRFVGRVPAAGQAPEAVAAVLADALGRVHRLKDLHVSVAVTAPAPRAAYALGRVRSPGAHAIGARPLTVLQLVALAGGFEEDADRGRVYLHRDGPGGRDVRILDLGAVESSGSAANDVPLEDGDTVFVPRAEEISVIGEVNLPGPFMPRHGVPVTVLSAISRARGFTRYADRSEVLWIRGSGATRRVQRLNLDRILRGADPDPEVLPGDVLYVTERAW